MGSRRGNGGRLTLVPHVWNMVAYPLHGTQMETLAIVAVLEAKRGKEQEVEAFLTSALPLVRAERGTIGWYALKLGPSRFGIFDTFADQSGRDAHLAGEIANALFARADELFATAPAIEQAEILAVKPRGVSTR